MRRSAGCHATAAAILVALGAAGCGKNVNGTYADASGMMAIELKDEGAATFRMGPMSEECTYTVDGSRIPVTCAGEQHVFVLSGDSLMAEGGSLMALHKQE